MSCLNVGMRVGTITQLQWISSLNSCTASSYARIGVGSPRSESDSSPSPKMVRDSLPVVWGVPVLCRIKRKDDSSCRNDRIEPVKLARSSRPTEDIPFAVQQRGIKRWQENQNQSCAIINFTGTRWRSIADSKQFLLPEMFRPWEKVFFGQAPENGHQPPPTPLLSANLPLKTVRRGGQ